MAVPGATAPALTATARSIANKVADSLLHRILSGDFAPGDPLPAERELAETMQVSRGSLREALRALAFLGVIEVQHGGRARVARVGLTTLLRPLSLFLRLRREGLRTLLEARSVFEVSTAKLAAKRIDDRSLARLSALLERKKEAAQRGKVARSIDLDAEFHQIIIRATSNAFLIEIGDSLYELGRLGRAQTSQSSEVTAAFLEDHEHIVQALRARNPEAVGRAMQRHMKHIERHLKKMEKTSAGESPPIQET